jgi:transcriptional regulator with XRE-family HTH domain
MNDGRTALGLLIVARRKAVGWSQRRLARSIGYSQPYLSQVETGHKSGDRVVLAIMTALDIDPADLPQFTELDE